MTSYIGFHAYQNFSLSFFLPIRLNHFTSFRSHKIQRKREFTIDRFNVYKEYAHYSCGPTHLSSQAKGHTIIQLIPEQEFQQT